MTEYCKRIIDNKLYLCYTAVNIRESRSKYITIKYHSWTIM